MTDTAPGFREIANSFEKHDDGYHVTIPDSWRQGRTAYGGITTGLALNAAMRAFPDVPALRTFQTTFVGPVLEHSVFTPRLLRQGKNVTTIAVEVTSDGNVSASLVFMFGAKRESELKVGFPAPETPAPDACEDFTPEAFKPFVPVFFNRFDTKLTAGHRPMSGVNTGYIRAWSRHFDEASRTGTDSLACIGDVLPPAATPMFNKMGPVSSMNWHMNILVDDVETTDGWWQVETHQTAAQDGYSSQIMRIWDRDGRLVAEGAQSMAIFI